MGIPAIPDHAINAAFFQPLRDGRGRVAGIDAHRPDREPEPLPLPVQPAQIGHRVMHVGRRHMRVGDDRMPPIDAAVIKIEEPLRLAVPHHVTGVPVGAAHLDFSGLRLTLGLLLQGLLAMRLAILGNRRIERRQILLRLHLNLLQIVLVLVALAFRCVESVYNTAPKASPLFTASNTISSKIS